MHPRDGWGVASIWITRTCGLSAERAAGAVYRANRHVGTQCEWAVVLMIRMVIIIIITTAAACWCGARAWAVHVRGCRGGMLVQHIYEVIMLKIAPAAWFDLKNIVQSGSFSRFYDNEFTAVRVTDNYYIVDITWVMVSKKDRSRLHTVNTAACQVLVSWPTTIFFNVYHFVLKLKRFMSGSRPGCAQCTPPL